MDVKDYDLAALRKDAEQVLAPRSKCAPTDPPVYIGHEPAPDGPDTRLALAFLALTDPTPLTVGVLVGMGFTKDEWGRLVRGNLYARKMLDDPDLSFNIGALAVFPSPRTAGELRQLILRMGNP